MLKKLSILGVGITNENEDDILKYLLSGLDRYAESYYIVTPNPEILVYAQAHPHYKKILNEAKIALPDGVGLFLAAGLMGHPLKERITGVDFMEEVCKRCAKWPISVGFLGGRGRVAELTAECLKKRYPWIEVGFAGEEWSFDGAQDLRDKGEKKTKRKDIDVLFVAFGHPKQEEWIYKNLDHLPVRVAMGVGGAFDYISGQSMRAPYMVRAMGFEWLYRLVREPWRWKRQLALLEFVWLSLREGLRR